jgi:hypothetical protein
MSFDSLVSSPTSGEEGKSWGRNPTRSSYMNDNVSPLVTWRREMLLSDSSVMLSPVYL